MNVLSLFDGISAGRLALARANISVNKYYASEVDKYAIKVSQANYPDIIQLGDINNWRDWDIDWSNIDLIIGGMEVPKPESEPLEDGQRYYIADPGCNLLNSPLSWLGTAGDEWLLRSCRIHLTPEAAITHAKAEIKAAGGSYE